MGEICYVLISIRISHSTNSWPSNKRSGYLSLLLSSCPPFCLRFLDLELSWISEKRIASWRDWARVRGCGGEIGMSTKWTAGRGKNRSQFWRTPQHAAGYPGFFPWCQVLKEHGRIAWPVKTSRDLWVRAFVWTSASKHGSLDKSPTFQYSSGKLNARNVYAPYKPTKSITSKTASSPEIKRAKKWISSDSGQHQA